MRTSLRSRLYWLGLGIGLFFFVGQILRGYQVFSTLTLDVSLLVRLSAAVLAGLVALGLQMAAWRYLMQDLGIKLTWRSIIGGYMLSFLPRYVPGSVWGYLSRSEWLKTSSWSSICSFQHRFCPRNQCGTHYGECCNRILLFAQCHWFGPTRFTLFRGHFSCAELVYLEFRIPVRLFEKKG